MKEEGKTQVDIQRCYEILELDRNASADEIKQSYKDIVNVWHPDRFSHNPRLKKKAEKKLKEVNQAYETLKSSLSSKDKRHTGTNKRHYSKAGPKGGNERQRRTNAGYSKARPKVEPRDKTEVVVEAGTELVLTTCYHFYKSLRRIFGGQSKKAPQEEASRR